MNKKYKKIILISSNLLLVVIIFLTGLNADKIVKKIFSAVPGVFASYYPLHNNSVYDINIQEDIFSKSNVDSWPNSSNGGNDAMYFILYHIAANSNPKDADCSTILGQPNKQRTTLVDINGDGLNDILYHSLSNSKLGYVGANYFAVLVNKGNFEFETAYKCLVKIDSEQRNTKYYGDCAINGGNNSTPAFFGNTCSNSGACQWILNPTQKAKQLSFLLPLTSSESCSMDAKDLNNHMQGTSYTLTDINGDGLIDFLYHNGYASQRTENPLRVVSFNGQYAILINKGDLNFEIEYKCSISSSKGVGGLQQDGSYYSPECFQ